MLTTPPPHYFSWWPPSCSTHSSFPQNREDNVCRDGGSRPRDEFLLGSPPFFALSCDTSTHAPRTHIYPTPISQALPGGHFKRPLGRRKNNQKLGNREGQGRKSTPGWLLLQGAVWLIASKFTRPTHSWACTTRLSHPPLHLFFFPLAAPAFCPEEGFDDDPRGR